MKWYWLVAFGLGAILWFLIARGTAKGAGWSSLADRFRAPGPPDGKGFWRQVVRLGGVPEGGMTDLIVSPAGLYLEGVPIFSIGRPPLLIPWSAVRFVSEHKVLFLRRYELDLAGITTLWIKASAFEALKGFLPKANEA